MATSTETALSTWFQSCTIWTWTLSILFSPLTWLKRILLDLWMSRTCRAGPKARNGARVWIASCLRGFELRGMRGTRYFQVIPPALRPLCLEGVWSMPEPQAALACRCPPFVSVLVCGGASMRRSAKVMGSFVASRCGRQAWSDEGPPRLK